MQADPAKQSRGWGGAEKQHRRATNLPVPTACWMHGSSRSQVVLLEMVEPLGTAQHPLSPKIEKFLHSPKVGGAQGGRCHRAASPTTQGTVRTTSQLPLPPHPALGSPHPHDVAMGSRTPAPPYLGRGGVRPSRRRSPMRRGAAFSPGPYSELRASPSFPHSLPAARERFKIQRFPERSAEKQER